MQPPLSGAARARIPPLSFDMSMSGNLSYAGPDGQTMHVGFVRLRDLHAMFVAMKERFLDPDLGISA